VDKVKELTMSEPRIVRIQHAVYASREEALADGWLDAEYGWWVTGWDCNGTWGWIACDQEEEPQESAIEIRTRVGRAMARDTIASDLPREWTGLDPQDADQLTAAGLVPGTPEWERAEAAAETAFVEATR
jgi:hypothetical protein